MLNRNQNFINNNAGNLLQAKDFRKQTITFSSSATFIVEKVLRHINDKNQ